MSLISVIRLVALISSGLLAGIFLGDRVGLGFARPALPPSSFVQLQQIQHVHFVRFMPVLQIAAVLSALIWLFLLRSNVGTAQFLLLALAVAGLLTVFALTMAINVPINNTLMTWNASTPPGDAMKIWKRWEQVNTVRAIISPIGFALQVLGLILA
jgi:uncharacterized membrane protein